MLARCDMCGHVDGDVVEGTDRLQADAATAVSIDLIRRRHGLIVRLSFWWEDRRARHSPVGNHVGIAVRVSRAAAGDAGEPAMPAQASTEQPA